MKPISLFIILLILSNCFQNAFAQVRLPRLIRDSMILQRDAPLKIWGWASPGENVAIIFNKKKHKTTTGKDGKWGVTLPPMKAGGPYTMQIEASNKIAIKDILMGDVWFCAGQSNMVHQMTLHRVRYEEDIQKANYPQIRHFWVPNTTDLQSAKEDLPGGYWKWANPSNVADFSAVAFFFARQLYEKYGVPIGLINASWGGTPIEAWMREESLKAIPTVFNTVEKNRDTAFVNSINRKAAAEAAARPQVEDKGLMQKWFDTSYVATGWRNIAIPGYWEDQGIRDLNGTVWYRREIEVPAAIANSQAKVFMGRIVDADAFYINGKAIGNTGYMYPQRRYTIPAGTLKAGKNLFVVRVTNYGGKGGFVPDKPYQLFGGGDTVDLTGYWQYKVGQVFTPVRSSSPGIAAQNQPTALYNAMVAPLVNYSIKGFLWYQGESNTGRPKEYASLQQAMIKDWRKLWNQPAAPFLFVQLPNFMDMSYLPMESQWAEFREAQAQSLSLPNTGMAVAIDLGEWNDIHPGGKKEVGERLARIAEKVAYGNKSIVQTGPTFQAAAINGNKVTLSFTHTGSGLNTRDGEAPAEFAIAGADKKFVWAKASIVGDKIVIWSDEIPNPLYVRYAWADNPVNPNVINKEDLPAAPFRTDH